MATNPDDIFVALDDVTKSFRLRGSHRERRSFNAVDHVNLRLRRGGSLGIAGESGSGKTTTAKMLLRLLHPTSGRVLIGGRDLETLHERGEMLHFRRSVQLMFQNPYEALNPRFTVERNLREPLLIHRLGERKEQDERIRAVLARVHLQPAETYLHKFPHQLSGGQLQRIVLARALIIAPELLIADEPVSMLDVSVRAGVLNLMKQEAEATGLTTVYISHDLSLIQYMCEMTAIMYLGAVVESGPTASVLRHPAHPYTRALLSAVPTTDPDQRTEPIEIIGEIPDPA